MLFSWPLPDCGDPFPPLIPVIPASFWFSFLLSIIPVYEILIRTRDHHAKHRAVLIGKECKYTACPAAHTLPKGISNTAPPSSRILASSFSESMPSSNASACQASWCLFLFTLWQCPGQTACLSVSTYKFTRNSIQYQLQIFFSFYAVIIHVDQAKAFMLRQDIRKISLQPLWRRAAVPSVSSIKCQAAYRIFLLNILCT